jgi:hypothetical protein
MAKSAVKYSNRQYRSARVEGTQLVSHAALVTTLSALPALGPQQDQLCNAYAAVVDERAA